MTVTINDLWNLAVEVGNATGKDPKAVFDLVGLILFDPPELEWYPGDTVRNGMTFACTGGDGVHFSIVEVTTDVTTYIIVMTIPMLSEENYVVGESLQEFLNLGYYTGYFVLEQLVYQPRQTWHTMEGFPPLDPEDLISIEQNKAAYENLELLRERFKLVPWERPQQRYEELQAKYAPFLERSEPR